MRLSHLLKGALQTVGSTAMYRIRKILMPMVGYYQSMSHELQNEIDISPQNLHEPTWWNDGYKWVMIKVILIVMVHRLAMDIRDLLASLLGFRLPYVFLVASNFIIYQTSFYSGAYRLIKLSWINRSSPFRELKFAHLRVQKVTADINPHPQEVEPQPVTNQLADSYVALDLDRLLELVINYQYSYKETEEALAKQITLPQDLDEVDLMSFQDAKYLDTIKNQNYFKHRKNCQAVLNHAHLEPSEIRYERINFRQLHSSLNACLSKKAKALNREALYDPNISTIILEYSRSRIKLPHSTIELEQKLEDMYANAYKAIQEPKQKNNKTIEFD